MLYDLINELLPDDPDDADISSDIAKFAGLAARAMGETDFSKQVQIEKKSKRGKYSKIHERVQNWLLTAMTADDVLSPEERCDAGNALNWVGDPRFDPENFYLPYGDDLGFVKIPEGSFMMGTKESDIPGLKEKFGVPWKGYYTSETPQHEVRLSSFYLSRYPVTVAQFRVFIQDSGYRIYGYRSYNRFDNHPVVEVSWEDAVAYCGWLTEKLKDRGWKIRLPTEAEWEYAARCNDGHIFPWGDDADPNKMNYDETGVGTTSPVGCFPSGNNSCGLSDMSGNVCEWCSDWFRSYPSQPVTDTKVSDKDSIRVNRGGSYDHHARYCRSACRFWLPLGEDGVLGFRLLRDAPGIRM